MTSYQKMKKNDNKTFFKPNDFEGFSGIDVLTEEALEELK